jgi:hypothetical protein
MKGKRLVGKEGKSSLEGVKIQECSVLIFNKILNLLNLTIQTNSSGYYYSSDKSVCAQKFGSLFISYVKYG